MARLTTADITAMADRLLGRQSGVTLCEHGPRLLLLIRAGAGAGVDVDMDEADLRLAPADFEARVVAPAVSFMRGGPRGT